MGTISLLGKNDHVITAYRDHGHALAVGMGMNECMAELYGKATGCSKGEGGGRCIFSRRTRITGVAMGLWRGRRRWGWGLLTG